jgi:glycosyltransferase involved in cell wall biosynthesis
MKLLCIIQCTNWGGMEQSTLLLLRELQRMGHESEVISLNEVGLLGQQLEEAGIPVSSPGYHGKWGWRSYPALRRMLKGKKPDLVLMVGHNIMATVALGNLCRERRILSVRFHHRGVLPDWVWRLIYRVSAPRFKHIVFPSNFIRDEAMEISPFLSEDQCRLLSFPVALHPVASAAERVLCRERLGLPVKTKLVGNAGWLIPRKRFDVFLSVAQLVLRQMPDARFVIAGDGSDLPQLKDLASRLGIKDQVIWTGWQKNMPDFFNSMSVILFNSDWDAMGRTPLEAMAQGIPVVASVAHGGLKEVIACEKHGYLFDHHDIALMADKVLALLRDDDLAARQGRQGRERIEEIGNVRTHAIDTLNLFLS